MVRLLLTFGLLLFPYWESVIVLCFVVRYFCFAWFVFLVSRGGWAALPRGAAGLSAVCDCGISLSYSLTILDKQKLHKKLRRIANIFLPINFNICFGCSKQPSH